MNNNIDNTAKVGTAGGTLISIFANISGGDVVRTAILAGVGAAVSFCVSYMMKRLCKRRRKVGR